MSDVQLASGGNGQYFGASGGDSRYPGQAFYWLYTVYTTGLSFIACVECFLTKHKQRNFNVGVVGPDDILANLY